MFKTKKELVFIILAGIFITNALVAELIGGKLIYMGPFIMSVGILPWPIVFLATDLINEYYGRSGVKKLSLITASLIVYAPVLPSTIVAESYQAPSIPSGMRAPSGEIDTTLLHSSDPARRSGAL